MKEKEINLHKSINNKDLCTTCLLYTSKIDIKKLRQYTWDNKQNKTHLNKNSNMITTVSYTHLDVYKRQVYILYRAVGPSSDCSSMKATVVFLTFVGALALGSVIPTEQQQQQQKVGKPAQCS